MKFFKYLFAFLFLLSLVSFAPGCGDTGTEVVDEADDPLATDEAAGVEVDPGMEETTDDSADVE